ncbi:DUF4397 domain-containing protein [Angustibacter luteus]|uniref:DUF4397 domain-containing protein n=1 Tax=Angustibacter luteus TaxID=658456 RepID=A0ABW1JKE9_9ACTN
MAGLALTMLGALLAPSSVAAAATPSVRIYLLNGLPGHSVGVRVDGRSVVGALAAAHQLGPVLVPRGTHKVEFVSAGRIVATSSMTVTAASSDVVIHRRVGASRVPEVTVFENDVSRVPSGQGRITVAHVAAIGPADIRVDKKVVFANVANGEFSSVKVPSGSYSVDVVPTGTTGPGVLGPLTLKVTPGALTRVYAVGDTQDASMNAIVQVIRLGSSGGDPTRVESGTGGQAAAAGLTTSGATGGPTGRAGAFALVAALLALALVPGPRRRLIRRVRRPERG